MADFTLDTAVVEQYVRYVAARCYPALAGGPIDVRLHAEQARPASIHLLYEVSAGDARHMLRVKVPLLQAGSAGAATDVSDRPRLAPLTAPDEKYELEYTALAEIQRHFEILADPRFSAVRVLDYLPQQRAVILEECPYPTLRALFATRTRLRPRLGSRALDAAFRNAGAWLRSYHGLTKQEPAPKRDYQRRDFIEMVGQFATYIAGVFGDEELFECTAAAAAELAQDSLPAELPLGLGHGDYAMRNIFVGPEDQIVVIDTLARWRTPIYEDIAYFLVALKANGMQTLTQGLAYPESWLDHYEAEFLAGYFDRQPVPYEAIRLYEIQALLDLWAFTVAPANTPAGSLMTRLRRWSASQVFRRYLIELLHALDVQNLPVRSAA